MRVKNAVWETIAIRAIFALWGLVAVTFLAVTGCDEVMEPEMPADTTPPTIVSVKWYSDWERDNPITDAVNPGDTIYTKVVFSEPMQYMVADDESALPALSIVIDGVAARYRVQPHSASGADFQSGDCLPLGSGTDNYLCKYTIPADTVGTVALYIGSATADIAGNALVRGGVYLEHKARLTVAKAVEPIPGPPKPWNRDIFTDLTIESVRENARAAFEPYGFSEEITERLVEMKVQHAENILRRRSGEISMSELSPIVRQLLVSGYGISNEYAHSLLKIYVEERPEEKYLLRGCLRGWLIESADIAYLIVKEANPEAAEEEFIELFRQAAREGTISIVGIECRYRDPTTIHP